MHYGLHNRESPHHRILHLIPIMQSSTHRLNSAIPHHQSPVMFILILLLWRWFCGGAAYICAWKGRHPEALPTWRMGTDMNELGCCPLPSNGRAGCGAGVCRRQCVAGGRWQ